MKKFAVCIFVLLAIIISSCNSSNEGTSIAGNSTSPLPTITIGKLTSDGKSTITMPLAVFGDSEDDVGNASIAIYHNGAVLTASLDPEPYYISSEEVVRFTLSGLVDGDVLRFVVTVQEDEATYEGTVSGDEDTEATNTLFGSLSTSDVSPNISIVSRLDGTNEIAIAASAFGGVDAVEGATILIAPISGGAGDEMSQEFELTAADYYNPLVQAVVFSLSDLYGIDFSQDRLTSSSSSPSFGDCEDVEGLCTIEFTLSLADGTERKYFVDASSLVPLDGEDQYPTDNTLSYVGFIGTSTVAFAHTFSGTVTSHFTDDCGEDFEGDDESYETSFTVGVGQGMIFFGEDNTGLDGNFDGMVGVIDDDGQFLMYYSSGGFAGTSMCATFEVEGTATSSTLNLTGTFLLSATPSSESCVLATMEFESE